MKFAKYLTVIFCFFMFASFSTAQSINVISSAREVSRSALYDSDGPYTSTNGMTLYAEAYSEPFSAAFAGNYGSLLQGNISASARSTAGDAYSSTQFYFEVDDGNALTSNGVVTAHFGSGGVINRLGISAFTTLDCLVENISDSETLIDLSSTFDQYDDVEFETFGPNYEDLVLQEGKIYWCRIAVTTQSLTDSDIGELWAGYDLSL